jgi:hypothetical protein
MSRLNFARPVKVHYAAAQSGIQFIIGDCDLDDAGIFALVCHRLPGRLAHNEPGDQA